MTVSIDLWVDEVAVGAPGVTETIAKTFIKKAISQFLLESAAWVEEINITLKANKVDYQLSTDGQGPILFVNSVYWSDRPLKPVSNSIEAPNWSETATEPTMYRGYLRDRNKVSIYPRLSVTPPSNKPATAFAVLGYDPEVRLLVPDIVYSHWYDAILSGTLHRLLAMQNKPYTDATLAMLHGKRFRNYISQARDMGRKNFMPVDTGFTFPFWA